MGGINHFKDEDLKKYNVFIETGTSYGSSANHLAKLCNRGYTIDIMDVYANKPANVEFLLGTSEEHLKHLCNLVLEDCVFWLDAHYPRDYGMSGPHINELPLVKELEIIAQNRKDYKDLILIDDLRIYIDDNYQSGVLPPSHQKGEANFMEIVKELFPNHTLKIDLEEEGYLSIIPPC